jgi:hypothetical protein
MASKVSTYPSPAVNWSWADDEDDEELLTLLAQQQEMERRHQQTLQRPDREDDAHRISQRQKQIAKGKNTIGYERYLAAVPKNQRHVSHPMTPDPFRKTSKRAWDSQVIQWRRHLHDWDPVPFSMTLGEGAAVVVVIPTATSDDDDI